MNKEQIKQAILKVAGNPESGAIFELADAMADAICEKEPEVKKFDPVKETRVVVSNETRNVVQ
ncbi:hypothetical protein UFOVP772_43 [uncultured Caudovirales phage]|uniref:Uncharacterized protein n=1 Tax=uncultured Caudovirales phage TaxID=2100421 RepID=A0A6J5NR60_9CAUD|nr:hypothetical protein UFOVP772_43 [uncultured Caudovirales phage]